MRPETLNRERGVTLIEVLITLVVISIGLLAMAMMMIKATQYSQASFDRSATVIQASDLVERLWASACELPANGNLIVDAWKTDNSIVIPAGWDGTLVNITESDNLFEVEIHIPLVNKNEAGGEQLEEITQSAFIPNVCGN